MAGIGQYLPLKCERPEARNHVTGLFTDSFLSDEKILTFSRPRPIVSDQQKQPNQRQAANEQQPPPGNACTNQVPGAEAGGRQTDPTCHHFHNWPFHYRIGHLLYSTSPLIFSSACLGSRFLLPGNVRFGSSPASEYNSCRGAGVGQKRP